MPSGLLTRKTNLDSEVYDGWGSDNRLQRKTCSTAAFLSLGSRTSDPTTLEAIAPLLKAHFPSDSIFTLTPTVTLYSQIAQRLLGSGCSPSAKLAVVSLSDPLISAYQRMYRIKQVPKFGIYYRQALLQMIGALAELYPQIVRDNPKQRHLYLRACVRCLQALEDIGERGYAKWIRRSRCFLGIALLILTPRRRAHL